MKFSIIVPIFNEERTVVILFEAIQKTMDRLDKNYEVIFVNDASTDHSWDLMRHLAETSPKFVAVDLAGHLGKSAAMQAGFDEARGEFIITMDGDLQNDPADIPKLFDKLREGYDVVCGWRRVRSDTYKKKIASLVAGSFRKMITGESLHDVGCPFRIFKRSALEHVYLSGGLHRLFALIMKKSGRHIVEVEVRDHPRLFGRTKFKDRARIVEGVRDLLRLSFFDIQKLMKRNSDILIKRILKSAPSNNL